MVGSFHISYHNILDRNKVSLLDDRRQTLSCWYNYDKTSVVLAGLIHHTNILRSLPYVLVKQFYLLYSMYQLVLSYIYQNNIGQIYGLGGGFYEGQYRINDDQNRIELSGVQATDLVIEYVADEARSINPTVHIEAEEALRSYIYYKLVERKSSVPMGEKARARQEYYNERRKANARIKAFSQEEALKTIRKNFKQSPKY